MPTLFPDDTKSIIEALLFVSGEPLSLKVIAETLGRDERDVLYYLKEIKADCEKTGKGFILTEVAEGYSFVTRPEFAPYVEKIAKPRLMALSQAALETLAIIAYRQPVTKSEIDEIRGVKSESSLNTLQERGLIKEAGRRDTAGRPILYVTSKSFLKYLGLRSLEELPKLQETEKIENESK